MKSPALLLFLSAVALIPLGCNKEEPVSKSAGANIGVVDLDKLAKAMGWKDEMDKNIEETVKQYGGQLNEYLKFRQEEVLNKRKEVEKTAALNTTQKEQLEKATSRTEMTAAGLNEAQIDELIQAYTFLNNEQAGAQQRLAQVKQAQTQQIIKAFLEVAQPSIRRVALASNRQVIVQPVGALYTDPSVDMTDRVVDDLHSSPSGSNVRLPEIPKLNMELPDKSAK